MYNDLVTNPVEYIKSSFIAITSEHRLLTDNEEHFENITETKNISQ